MFFVLGRNYPSLRRVSQPPDLGKRFVRSRTTAPRHISSARFWSAFEFLVHYSIFTLFNPRYDDWLKTLLNIRLLRLVLLRTSRDWLISGWNSDLLHPPKFCSSYISQWARQLREEDPSSNSISISHWNKKPLWTSAKMHFVTRLYPMSGYQQTYSM